MANEKKTTARDILANQKTVDNKEPTSVLSRRLDAVNKSKNSAPKIQSCAEMEIDELQFLAVLDSRTSAICRDHDGEIIKTENARQGDNAPPLHPNCRSTLIPYIGEEYAPKQRIARNPKTGKNYYVSGSTKYEDWAKTVGIPPLAAGIQAPKFAVGTGAGLTSQPKAKNIIIEDILGDVTPGEGSVVYQDGMSAKDMRRKVDDFAVAEYMKTKYGGDYVVLKEATEENIKMPDLLRNGAILIEVKRPISISGIDSRVRDAIKQLPYSENKVKGIKRRVIFIDSGSHLSSVTAKEIKRAVNNRVSRSKNVSLDGVIIHRKGKIDIIIKT